MEKPRIQKLLNQGFTPEIISTEFSIPIEEIEEIKDELQNIMVNNKKTKTKMDIIRRNYVIRTNKNQSYSDGTGASTQERSMTKDSEISAFIESLGKDFSKKSKITTEKIEDLLTKIKTLPLSIEELITIYKCMESYFEATKLNSTEWSAIKAKLFEQISNQTSKIIQTTNNIEELEKIAGTLPNSSFFFSGQKARIKSHIREIHTRRIKFDIMTNISSNIAELLSLFLSENPDIKQMEHFRNKEIERRMSSRIWIKTFCINTRTTQKSN